nr:MAG TPA: hypothetical protein [Caudoviricetes sp.]
MCVKRSGNLRNTARLLNETRRSLCGSLRISARTLRWWKQAAFT